MEKVDKKQCPSCESLNVIDTGDRFPHVVSSIQLNLVFPEPQIPIYRCNEFKCGKLFKYLSI